MYINRLYSVIVNALIFFFLVSIINGVKIGGGSIGALIIAALLYGFLMMMVVFMLKFFKITVNVWSRLLLSVVLAFVYFFLIYTGVLGLGVVEGSIIDLGVGGASIIRLNPLSTLVWAAVISGSVSALLEMLRSF